MNPSQKPKRPIVIKFGGSLMEDPALEKAFLGDVAALSRVSPIILVHGGGKDITRALEAENIPTKFVEGLRYTDDATMKVVERVLSEINARIVNTLKGYGVGAAGFSGKTNGIMLARTLREWGRVGQPEQVNQTALEKLIEEESLPVFYSVAGDSSDRSLNVNADDFALAMAVSCRARELVFLTDTGGLIGPDQQVLRFIYPREVHTLIEKGVISGGMRIKTMACVAALKEGVGLVDIVKDIHYKLDHDRPFSAGTRFLPNPELTN